MKFIYTILLLTIPSLIFAQDAGLNQSVDRNSIAFRSDPFTSYILKADNPCNDQCYLELKNRSQVEMSDSEFAIFGKKAEDCQSFLDNVTETRLDTVKVETNNAPSNPTKPFILAGGVVALTVIIIIAV